MPLVKEEYDNLLKEIASTGGDTPAMLDLMQKLRDDFDEREGMLRKDDEKTDKEPPEGAEEKEEEIRKESTEDNKEDKGLRRDPLSEEIDKLRADNDTLRRKYIERFFSDPEEAKVDQEEDTKDDGKAVTFDDLFKKKED